MKLFAITAIALSTLMPEAFGAEEIQAILDNPVQLQAITLAAFNSADTDGSGRIDKSELGASMVNLAAEQGLNQPTPDEIEEAIKELDLDKSGTINLTEFGAFIQQVLEEMVRNA